ncbi:family 88 glycosyl hydrolase [Coprinopsis marcescibilis]|uniref:Family 88 glycosyl hydrolase n=1 Tax=Coprinopsis marcescibilis TaxID=230819 RepID=A0A5C3KXT3_COPMA|nr:family 88 glycosyl hydrolase [Coprinopsis marcescibilis]
MPSLSTKALLLYTLVQTVHLSTANCPGSGTDPYPFSPGFDIKKVTVLAQTLPSHSWEYGTTAQALLELYNPQFSVFGNASLPVPKVSKSIVKSLAYASKKFQFGTGNDALVHGGGAAADPASLGVSAVLLGQTESVYADKAKENIDWLVGKSKRSWNDAMSHRKDIVEHWADFVYMVPPFLAYYGAANDNEGILLEAVNQCRGYRQILRANTTAPYKGTWHHIIGPQSADFGLWSTGNAWAAAGMARVLATVLKAPMELSWRDSAATELSWFIREILDGAMNSPADNGLLRNYLNDVESPVGFGEVAGTSLLAAVAYRMAILRPKTYGDEYIGWADGIRKVLAGSDTDGNPYVREDGIVAPTINPLNWRDPVPLTTGSPEGQAFVVLMYAAWRDCVLAGKCKQ